MEALVGLLGSEAFVGAIFHRQQRRFVEASRGNLGQTLGIHRSVGWSHDGSIEHCAHGVGVHHWSEGCLSQTRCNLGSQVAIGFASNRVQAPNETLVGPRGQIRKEDVSSIVEQDVGGTEVSVDARTLSEESEMLQHCAQSVDHLGE